MFMQHHTDLMCVCALVCSAAISEATCRQRESCHLQKVHSPLVGSLLRGCSSKLVAVLG